MGITLQRCDFMLKQRFFIFGIGICFAVTVAGCGNNVFEGVGKKSSDTPGFSNVEDLTSRLEDSSSQGQFQQISDAATELLQDPQTTTADAQELLIIRSKAVIGENELGVLDLVTTLDELNDENDSENVFESLRGILTDVNTDTLQSAAVDINSSAYIASTNSGVEELDKTQQLFRGSVNALAVNQMIISNFNILDDEVTLRDENASVVSIMDDLFNPSSTVQATPDTPAVRPTLPYFYRSMEEAFDASNSLPDDVADSIHDIGEAVGDMERLYAAMQQANGTYTVGSTVYQVGTSVNTELREDNINDALSAIFDEIN